MEDDTTIIRAEVLAEPCAVMIVDDDELAREQLSSLLSYAGYRVITCASGEEAIRRQTQERCSVVLSDWEMPDMDGIALTRHLRKNGRDSYTYILLLTIRRSKRDIVAGLQAGADDYIVKGASTEELLARMETARRIVNLERSLRIANSENRKQAVTDAVTGIRNRHYLMKYLPREFERSRRYGHTLSVLTCDLDRFKLVNDGFGHEAGDDVLREFCSRTEALLRTPDWMARAGGEEFTIVLPETGLGGAKIVAERIRGAFASSAVRTAAGPIAATVSIGVASVRVPRNLLNLTFNDMLRAADRCLYESKESGRNRVTAVLVKESAPEPRTALADASEVACVSSKTRSARK